MNTYYTDLVNEGFDMLHPAMVEFLVRELKKRYGSRWWDEVLDALKDQRMLPGYRKEEQLIEYLDRANCCRLLSRRHKDLFYDSKTANSCKTWASELMGVRNKLEAKANKTRIALEKKRQERTIKQEAAVRTAKELLELADWEAIQGGEAVSRAISDANEAVKAAQQKYIHACNDRSEKTSKTAALEMLQPKLQAAQTREQEAQKSLDNAKTNLQNANNAVSDWEEKLAGRPADRKAADAEIDAIDKKIGTLQEQKDKAANNLKDADLALENNRGQLDQAKLNRETQSKALEEAEKKFRDALERQGFHAEEAYRLALRPEGVELREAALEAWIRDSRNTIKAHDDSIASLKGSIEQLEQTTAGLSRVDVAAMELELDNLRNELAQQRKDEGNAKRSLEMNQKIYDELFRLAKDKIRLEKAMAQLQPLSDTANSRTPFSRYVLEDFFSSVIEQANVHLDTMTNGEYQLVRGESEDGRKLKGLGLRALNTFTNQERDTASLSGGQSFEASLALALGLSDVVQRESGSTIRIDSMFIDEGFGSLDASRLDSAVEVLKHLSSWNRQVGIISHVPQLEECLQKKLRVIASPHGSHVRVETDEGAIC